MRFCVCGVDGRLFASEFIGFRTVRDFVEFHEVGRCVERRVIAAAIFALVFSRWFGEFVLFIPCGAFGTACCEAECLDGAAAEGFVFHGGEERGRFPPAGFQEESPAAEECAVVRYAMGIL